ncbi:putative kinesin [Trypanosoma theileri]|uniref:Putative kinesin n=1 Tax=Trypanosoma theileri TaxID=67003 RepID=A0A1X0NTD4_9TRYP|nr:putative kinesin [Trypanosoma theileri]ORC87952.1 putative kinesin [Trypanosoma theileri]
MASETSAVLVAVRVRPFNTRESPLECTVTVPDTHSITLTDVGSNVCGSGQQHAFSFDKIFWSIPPHVLPLCMSGVSPPTQSPRISFIDGMSSVAVSRAGSIIPGMGTVSTSRSSSITGLTDSSSAAAAASRLQFAHLPCFAEVPEYDDQSSVYDFIGPRMYESAMTGFNSCLFAYGQTGSGKTHSMMGPPEGFTINSTDRGILPRLCEDLFDMMRKEREEDESVSFNVECGFLEIYCERVRDLLLHSANKENTSSGGSFHKASSSYAVTSSSTALSTTGGSGSAGPTTNTSISTINTTITTNTNTNMNTNNSTTMGGGGGGGFSTSGSSSSSLRIRQHPTRGPFVEGLSLVKVRDAKAAMRLLVSGLRERATAETRMNEHSSRSHALLQLHITRISLVGTADVVVPKTRVCKVSLVDLAGSERVSQSGATGDRFEEARNINLSLTTLGRVMLQLTDKQAGRNVVPAYRDSVLTWLLADSLGGNSKTIMLATVAPSAACYQQTLNTLRFAGVAKKVINVATVNEDKQFQKLIASLRQQIVKLTLQLEEGKAAEVHHDEICALRRERDELQQELSILRASLLTMVPGTEMVAVQRRASDLEEANAQLHKEKNQLQRQLISTTTALREELAQKRGEVMKLNELLVNKDSELQEWRRRYREETVRRETSPPQVQHYQQQQQQQQQKGVEGISTRGWSTKTPAAQTLISSSLQPPAPLAVIAEPSRRREDLELRVEKLTKDIKEERRKREDVDKTRNALQKQMETLQQEHMDTLRQLEELQSRLVEKTNALDITQSDLAATRTLLRVERGENSTAERERELTTQLEKARADYLNEKQTNVNLLLRLSKMAQQVTEFKKETAAKGRDITELEQLLLEETETSERYYMRLRYFRDLLGITVLFLHASSARKETDSANNNSNNNNNNNTIDKSNPVIDDDFLWEQLLCDYTRDEAYSRVLLEQEYLTTMLELVRQGGLLYQLNFAAANEELMELRATEVVSTEELQHLRRKVETIEKAYEKEIAEKLKLQTALSNSESVRERLLRQVDDLRDELGHLQKSNETLIQKIVEVQASQDTFNVASMEVTPNTISLNEEETEREKSIQEQKQKQLAQQVVQYQEEIGLLHAQLEKERNDKIEKTRSVQREKEELLSELHRVREDRKATLKESTQIVKDYEDRVNELEEVVTTLRKALDEECNNTDKARDQMQRAEMARREAVDKVNFMSRNIERLESDRDISEKRYTQLSQQLQQLQSAYFELEKRVMESKLHDADVYLTIERDDDDKSWMEKAQREKEVLERQKRDVRRLNEELLEMVRQRNESLRAVHRQITKLQRGGVSPEMDEFSSSSPDPKIYPHTTTINTINTTMDNDRTTTSGNEHGDNTLGTQQHHE